MEEKEGNSQTKTVIKIPSYQEVFESKSTTQSLFAPSQTFSQAFAHLKSSEFYSPPPPPISISSSQQQSQPTDNDSSREIRQTNVQSSSASNSSVPSSSTSASYSQKRNAILVSHRQKGNPLLKHIRNVKWDFAEVPCDYMLGQNSCALYLSLRYHLLHPDYLYYRIRELQKNFKLRVVLCHVDVEDVGKPLLEVTKTALLHDCTLLCGWSLEECGRYLETIKVYENKSADIIQGQMDTDYLSRLSHALTTVRHVNKTDVVTLGTTFGTLAHIMDASMEDLARCPGIGERKVKRLYDTFHEPFKLVLPTSYSVDPGTSTRENVEPASAKGDEEKKGSGKDKKRRKKEPEVTVKSTLSVAFSKYADKFGKTREGEESSAMEVEAQRMNREGCLGSP